MIELCQTQERVSDWPPEVDLVLSALEAGGAPEERRRIRRVKYQVKAALRLFADSPDAQPWTLYTRDINHRGLGFITRHRLPLGYGGEIQIPSPGGEMLTMHGTLYRCRETSHGWFEGALYFNREQSAFLPPAVLCEIR